MVASDRRWRGLGPSSVSFLVLWIACVQNVSSEEVAPTPLPNPEKDIRIEHKIEKGNAVLSCIVKDLGRRRIIWSRLSDPYPIAIGTYRFHPKKKYQVQNEANTNILTIKGVGLSDSGEYECRVSGPFPLKEVISLNIQAGPRSTYFLPTNRSVSCIAGMTVVLPCQVENLNVRTVMWKDGRNNLISLRKKIYNGNNRMSVLHKTRPEWNLRIEKVEPEDFGYFTCIVNTNPVLTRTIELINDEPPHFSPVIIRDTNFKSKVEVMEEDTVTLVCNFHSYPPPKVRWYKRFKEAGKTRRKDLGAVGNDYTLRSVKLEQAGDYVCIARNGMKKDGRARTRLIVKALPTTQPTTVPTTTFIPSGPVSPRLYHEDKRTGQQRGRNAQLTCFAIGQPRPNIHWKRHGKRLINDHKYKIASKSQGRFTTHSTLTIRVVSSRDFGSYECVGYNQLGLKQTNIELYELK